MSAIAPAEHQDPAASLDLDVINPLLEETAPAEVVDWAARQFGDELVMSSSFGAESAMLIHLVTRIRPRIKIIFIDTGYLFPETHAFMAQLRHRFDLNVWVYRTNNDPIAWLQQAGEGDPTWRKDPDACCAANKNEPMNRAMRELAPAAWLRGVRRHQTAARARMKFVEWSTRYNAFAVSPLLKWTTRDIYAYMKQHDLPHHPLYEKGYPSIGCNPLTCTKAVGAGDDPRAGRWADTGKVECGINMINSLDSAEL
jgi:phosphoadenosine phosphosulfate reductase